MTFRSILSGKCNCFLALIILTVFAVIPNVVDSTAAFCHPSLSYSTNNVDGNHRRFRMEQNNDQTILNNLFQQSQKQQRYQGERRLYNTFQLQQTSTSNDEMQQQEEQKQNEDEKVVLNENDIVEYARNAGIDLSLSTLGPAYRAVARASHNNTLILGYVEGFIRPAGNILHVDSMKVFRKAIIQCKKETAKANNNNNDDNDDENKIEFYKNNVGSSFGLSLLLGYMCLLHGKKEGNCVDAEFLAIDDEEKQHKKLVNFYKRSGFQIIKYVGDDIQSIPDRLVWGGCGTLMKENIDVLLDKWTKILKI